MTRDPKDDLRRYLQRAREALVWKLDGLDEYDVRRPLTPTGTNLLGLVKHVAGVEFGYFCLTFDRPLDEDLPWLEDDAEPNADFWVPADESRNEIVALYQRAWAVTDAVVAELPTRRGRTRPVVAGRARGRDPASRAGAHDRRDRSPRR